VARHKWACVVQIPITEAEAAVAVRTGRLERDVTMKDVESIGMGCFVCEQPLTFNIINADCPGEPEEQ
jgi:hypothetical protein